MSEEVTTSTSDSESQQPQTLYVAIQPGAESGQGDQPAVYLEVVETGSGTEVTSSDGQVNLVQEEMVIDNGMYISQGRGALDLYLGIGGLLTLFRTKKEKTYCRLPTLFRTTPFIFNRALAKDEIHTLSFCIVLKHLKSSTCR